MLMVTPSRSGRFVFEFLEFLCCGCRRSRELPENSSATDNYVDLLLGVKMSQLKTMNTGKSEVQVQQQFFVATIDRFLYYQP